MFRLARLAVYALAIYLLVRIGYPDSQSTLYHAIIPPCLLGAAIGVFVMLKAVSLSSRWTAAAVEAGFALAVLLFVGFTMPQNRGGPPLQQFIAGQRPTQATARDGVQKLGLDPNGSLGRCIVSVFPTH